MSFTSFISKLVLISLLSIGLTSCSVVENSHLESIIGRVSHTYTGVAESTYCSTPIVYGSSVTITGAATFEEREFNGSYLGAPSTPKNIRYAEIIVTNSSGKRVQCAETAANGTFSFEVPASSSLLTISVNSRINNSIAKVSVLNMPEQNIHYSITDTFTPDSSKTIATLNATADGNIYGAAFHMLDLIVNANDFLRSELSTCSIDINGCIDFTTAEKVSVYWEPGFNPNSYFGEPEYGLSFYLTSYSRLFILGGINGDSDSSDTDHFDDSIFLHEYGHFLEDIYSTKWSPGGAHSGDRAIDPRLAFSEAWANFFQAAVIYGPSHTDPRYLDTIGNDDGIFKSYFLNVPLEYIESSCDPLDPILGCDIPTVSGEGNYREFAITRFLWDIFDTVNDSENLSGGFNQVWASITDGNGFTDSSTHFFKSIGLMHDIQQSLSDGTTSPITDWSTARSHSENLQLGNRTAYANTLTTSGNCTTRNFNMNPVIDLFDTAEYDEAEFADSNLFFNNDFYHYHHVSPGPASFEINFNSSLSTKADLDLFIYDEVHSFGLSGILNKATNLNSSSSPLDVENEAVTFSNLAAGHYMINVKARSHDRIIVGDSTDYEILLGGTRLCP